MTITMSRDRGAGAFRDPGAPSLASVLVALTAADLPAAPAGRSALGGAQPVPCAGSATE